jgi:hypothetical protein
MRGGGKTPDVKTPSIYGTDLSHTDFTGIMDHDGDGMVD